MLLGTRTNGMYFLGYDEETNVRPAFDGMPHTAKCGDPRIRLTHEQQVARARYIETVNPADTETATLWGCHGWSPILKKLRYLDYNDVWLVPFGHAAMLGLVKRFWGLCIGKKGTRGKKKKDYTGPAAGAWPNGGGR